MSGAESEPEAIAWRVACWQRRPGKAAALLASFAALSFLVHVAFGSAWFDAAALAALFGVTYSFWLPVGFSVGAEGVRIREFPQRALYRLERFGSWRIDGETLRLWPRGGTDGDGSQVLELPLTPEAEVEVRGFLRRQDGMVERGSG
jgi:hypothetical protein